MSESLNPNTDTQPIEIGQGRRGHKRVIRFIAIPIILVIIGVFACIQSIRIKNSKPPFLATYPTPSLTSQSPPSPEVIQEQYWEEFVPFMNELDQARRYHCEPDWPAEDEFQIIFVPMDSRLYYFQEILYPDLVLGNPNATTKIYMTYNYGRGTELSITTDGSYWIKYEPAIFGGRPDTQVVITDLQLFLETEEPLCIVERSLTSAGIGMKSYRTDTRHRDLVADALSVPKNLNASKPIISWIVNNILQYATGIDYLPELAPSRRLALIEWALKSPYWADRAQAADTLGYKGAEAETSLPLLRQIAEEDENPQVRRAAEFAVECITSTSAED